MTIALSFGAKPQTGRPKLAKSLQTTKGTIDTCLHCNKTNHSTAMCFTLGRKPYTERDQFVRKHGLCYGCMTPGHKTTDCQQRATCKKCSMRHPTSLHREPGDWPTKNNPSRDNKKTATEAATYAEEEKHCKSREQRTKKAKTNFTKEKPSR